MNFQVTLSFRFVFLFGEISKHKTLEKIYIRKTSTSWFPLAFLGNYYFPDLGSQLFWNYYYNMGCGAPTILHRFRPLKSNAIEPPCHQTIRLLDLLSDHTQLLARFLPSWVVGLYVLLQMCWPSTDFWIPRSFEKGIPPSQLPYCWSLSLSLIYFHYL